MFKKASPSVEIWLYCLNKIGTQYTFIKHVWHFGYKFKVFAFKESRIEGENSKTKDDNRTRLDIVIVLWPRRWEWWEEDDKEAASWKKWGLGWVVDHGQVEVNQMNEQLFQAQRSEEEWYYLRRIIKPYH